jgi:large subunit ribosomal protein L31e
MVEKLERTYTVPLRKEYLKAPRYRRTEKASRALRAFLVKHMKSDDVKIGRHLNEHLWMHGMRNPPPRVKVNCAKVEGVVYAELFGKPLKLAAEEKKVEEKKPQTALEKAVAKVKKGVKAPEVKKEVEAKEPESKEPSALEAAVEKDSDKK